MNDWKYKLPIAVHSSLDDANLTAEEFRVMAAISRKAGDDGNGRHCFASIPTLAKTCRLHPQTVRNAIECLVKLGWLSVLERSGRTKILIPQFANPSGFKVGVTVSSEGYALEEGDPSGFKEGHPSGFKEDEGIPIRDTHKGSQPEALKLPFESVEFQTAWQEWNQFRAEKKNKLTPTSIKAQFKKFVEWGEPASIQSIQASITNGYLGLFPQKSNNPEFSKNSQPTIPSRRRGEIERVNS